jgi:TonB family protein
MQLGETKFGLMTDYRNTARNFLGQIDSSFRTREDINAMNEMLESAEQQRRADLKIINGRATSLPRPRYPSEARNAKVTGTVNVLVTIDEKGKVISAQAISGHTLLRPPAEEAARQARFNPPSIEGKPVKITGIIRYNFELQ